MAKKITLQQKNALREGLKVFLWAGLSAVLPLIIAYVEQDPKWAMLAPVINAVAFALKTEYRNRKQ